MLKDDMAKLNTLCLPFSVSVSVKKCLQDPNSSLKLWSWTSSTMSSTLILFAPNPICFPCWVFCVKRKSQEILHDKIYTCTLLKVLEHCVFWHCLYILLNAKNFFVCVCVCVYYQTPLPFLARFGSNFEQSFE